LSVRKVGIEAAERDTEEEEAVDELSTCELSCTLEEKEGRVDRS
jgi:hypothetical protein